MFVHESAEVGSSGRIQVGMRGKYPTGQLS